MQTTSSPDSRRRLAFFNNGRPYRVHVRGLADGGVVDAWTEVSSIGRGLDANLEWAEVEDLFVNERDGWSPTPAIAAMTSTPTTSRRARCRARSRPS